MWFSALISEINKETKEGNVCFYFVRVGKLIPWKQLFIYWYLNEKPEQDPCFSLVNCSRSHYCTPQGSSRAAVIFSSAQTHIQWYNICGDWYQNWWVCAWNTNVAAKEKKKKKKTTKKIKHMLHTLLVPDKHREFINPVGFPGGHLR